MEQISMPGFTADNALYATSGHYRTRGYTVALARNVYSASLRGRGMSSGMLGSWCHLFRSLRQ
jgi:hypothetical protein